MVICYPLKTQGDHHLHPSLSSFLSPGPILFVTSKIPYLKSLLISPKAVTFFNFDVEQFIKNIQTENAMK